MKPVGDHLLAVLGINIVGAEDDGPHLLLDLAAEERKFVLRLCKHYCSREPT